MEPEKVVEASFKAIEELITRTFRDRFKEALYTDVAHAQKAESLALAETEKAKQETERQRQNLTELQTKFKELSTEYRDLQKAHDALAAEYAALEPQVAALRKAHSEMSAKFQKFVG